MQNGCQFHIKFHEEFKNELYFSPRGWNRMKFLPKVYKVELFQLIKRQLEITDINFRRIYEDSRSLPMMPIEKVNLRYAKWMSMSYKIS